MNKYNQQNKMNLFKMYFDNYDHKIQIFDFCLLIVLFDLYV